MSVVAAACVGGGRGPEAGAGDSDSDESTTLEDTDVTADTDPVPDTDPVADTDSDVGEGCDSDELASGSCGSGLPLHEGTGLPAVDSGNDSGNDTGSRATLGPVLPVDQLWGGTWLGVDDYYRYVYDRADGVGLLRAGAGDCTMPDGRVFHRVWITGGGAGYAAEARFFDPATGSLVAASVAQTSWITVPPRTWYGEDLRTCSRRTPAALSRAVCTVCGTHPGCTAFTLPPYDTQPVHASLPPYTNPICPGRCGDGIVQPEESCDDGNLAGGDGCSATCVAESCGDGVIEPRLESCDDANTADGDGCNHLCRDEGCGDGLLQPTLGEQCDDGNTVADDGCDERCTLRLHGLVNTRYSICGLADDGTPACFGDDRPVQSTIPDQVFVRLVAAAFSVCGIDASRSVTCWGDRARIYSYTPPPGFGPVLDYAPGSPYADALDLRGDRLEWWTPTPITTPGNWSRVESSTNGGCAWDDRTGRVSCFPCTNCDSPAGVRLQDFDEWSGTELGVRDDGLLVGWGRNDYGQNRVPAGTYSQVVASFWNACALSTAGRGVCWGSPANTPGSSPLGIVLTEIAVMEGSAGDLTACGVAVDGRVGCWGPHAGEARSPTFPP